MAGISLGQALRNAIEAEDASNRYYTLLAESTDDAEAKGFLEGMAKDEARHKAQIEELAQRLGDREIPALPDDNCELVETRGEWAHADQLDVESAIRIAIEAEDFAALYYDALSCNFEDQEVREFFEALARTEEQHAKRLRAMQE